MKPKIRQTGSQRAITTFFTKGQAQMSGAGTGEKRKKDDKTMEGEKREDEAHKKIKPGEEILTEEASAAPAGSLTPEQKKQIKEKQTVARLRLLSKQMPLIDPLSIGHTWFNDILDHEFRKPYFQKLSDFYVAATSRATVYPKREDIFSWTRFCELQNVKVVIIGQDPYHGANQAHGLCFSVQKGVPTPPSLLNMYKELVKDEDVPDFKDVPKHGYLVGWAEQGVLLLNAVLTVEASKANSHKEKGWEHITTEVIKWISQHLNHVVFLLWGKEAEKVGTVVDKKRHTVLTAPHPSPLSAHRGFFGCKHFSRCNKALKEAGKQEIRWQNLP